MNEWVVLVIRVMYKDATTRLNGRESEAFSVKVICSQSATVHHRLEALSREFREGLPMELLYADDLVLMAESDEFFNRRVEEVEKRWKQSVSE